MDVEVYEISDEQYKMLARKIRCEESHLFFTRYFFKHRQNLKFLVNWHHALISDVIERVMSGEIQNVVINVAPGAGKTELIVINLIARALALNPWCRFLHLTYSDELAQLNSKAARDLVESDEFQAFWPLKIASDSKAKSRWNVEVNGKPAGGVYATSIGGQVTGFRAGHMTEGFNGCILLDDVNKADSAFSRAQLQAVNRKLLSTVKSRKANPKTPVIMVQQRISTDDATQFVLDGNLPGKWEHVSIPAIIDDEFISKLPQRIIDMVDRSVSVDSRYSYWEYKEPISELVETEKGTGRGDNSEAISKFTFASQWMQNPVKLGGNMIKSEYFKRYSVLPKIKYRKIFADTAQKTAERNDFSVFECWGYGEDGLAYVLDILRIKAEAPELEKQAKAFWIKHSAMDTDSFGWLRGIAVEDKSSGTGLIQTLQFETGIPVFPIQRNTDKVLRVNDALPYIAAGNIAIPESAPWVDDFILECEAFNAEMTHKHDDQIDPMCDAIAEFFGSSNDLKTWERLG